MKDIDDKEIVARADAQAWNPETDEYLSIKVETDLKEEIGEYNVKFSTNSGLQIIRKIWVVDQRVVENKKQMKRLVLLTSSNLKMKLWNLML